MNAGSPAESLSPEQEPIAPGRQLVRVADAGASLLDRAVTAFHRLTWRTPLHGLKLRGKHPLKLLAVPDDPIHGDPRAGAAILGGDFVCLGETIPIEGLDFAKPRPAGIADYLQSFAWLRDLAAAAERVRAAPLAEEVMRIWVRRYGGHVDEAAWRPDLWGRRILHWAAHAPLILSSTDLVYRTGVLNALARGARHLDSSAASAPIGLARVSAWAGVVAAGLLIPGGEARLARGEVGLARALDQAILPDGGIVSRSPVDLVEAIALLAQLIAVYDARRQTPPDAIVAALLRSVPALLGILLGDGCLSSWQGGGPLDTRYVEAVLTAAGSRGRPLRQAHEWGFQRLAGGQSVVVADCAPPPAARLARGGCASTLAFEMSDGPHRLIVNCGGDPAGLLPPQVAAALRTTAAHSTLTLADSNSTAIHDDGSLGRGVTEIELDRQEMETASRIEASHDGYVRRHGLRHKRQLVLSTDGRELRGEDQLLPAGRLRMPEPASFAIRFHLGHRVEATALVDGQGALIRPPEGSVWQFRCRGGALAIEESVWIDGRGRMLPTQQIVITGQAPAGGTGVSWTLRRAS
ncbi:MAG: heparinase II/III family protein [Sphingomonadaceae bacterium]|nr:heparinase II/III family protein [Sphingomonadaceae bacterium]